MPNPKNAYFLAAVLAASLAGTTVLADTPNDRGSDPDPGDLRHYLTCNALAEVRPLSFEEAADCSIAIQRLKLAFVPDMTFNAYNHMPVADQARVNLQGYRAFRLWLEAHATEVRALKKEVLLQMSATTQ